MKRLLVAAVASLALAPAAAAKEPIRAEVCGASECTEVTDRHTLSLLASAGGAATTRVPPPTEYYMVEFTIAADRERHRFNVDYVPSAQMIYSDRWRPISVASARAFDRVIAGLRPFPPPTLSAVFVRGKSVATDPNSYLELFELPAAEPGEPASSWIPIDLQSVPPSPWTAAEPDLLYSTTGQVLERGGEIVPLPDALAADVEAARPLGDGGSGFRWLLVALAVLGVAALGGAVTWIRRRGALAPTRRPEPI